MASSDRFVMPFQTAWDAAGLVEPGAKLYFFITATSTPKDTFSDSALAVPNINPVIADAAGRFGAIFLGSGDYRVILTDANDVQIWAADPVSKAATTAATTTVAGIVELATEAEGLAGASTTLVPPVRVTAAMIQQGFGYGTTGGTANAITGTPTVMPSALAAGMEVYLTASATNTGPTTLNWAGLGIVAVRTAGGAGSAACTGGEILSGNLYKFTYSAADSAWLVQGVGEAWGGIHNLTEDTTPDGAADWWLMYDDSAKLPKKVKPSSLAATQAQCEARTVTGQFLSPANLRYMPETVKGWGVVTVAAGTPTLQASVNVDGIVDTGEGQLTVTIGTDMSSTNYAILPSTELETSGEPTATQQIICALHNGTRAVGSFTIVAFDTVDGYDDPSSYSFAFLGDFP